MDCIFTAPLSKALYNLCVSIHPFTHTDSHSNGDWMQGSNQLVRSNWGLGFLLRDPLTRPGWDRIGNPPTARRQLLPPKPYRPLYGPPYRPPGSSPMCRLIHTHVSWAECIICAPENHCKRLRKFGPYCFVFHFGIVLLWKLKCVPLTAVD